MYRVTENGALAEAKCYGFDATGILTGSSSDQMLNLEIESIYIVPTMILREYEADKRKRAKTNNFKPNAVEQIVGRERRERVSQLDLSGDA